MATAGKRLKYPLLLVEWVDSTRLGSEWTHLEHIQEPHPHRCISTGYLIKENRHAIIIAPHIGDADDPSNHASYGTMMIPKVAITRRRRLK